MIAIKNITLYRSSKTILKDASITINPGEKASIVGRNGAGKSSFFSLLTQRLQVDAGDASIPKHWHIAEVAQDMPETSQAATEFVLAGDQKLQAAQQALIEAEASEDGNLIAIAHILLADANAFDAPARAQALLLGLGFKPDQVNQPVNSFSGGWRMRIQLARALMSPSDLLLLDEPTNHLDLDALIWLEGWLKRYEGTLLVISHDREFLDSVTQVTIHLHQMQLTRYTGNYSAFENMRAERLSQQAAAHEKQALQIKHLQKFIDRFKAKASKAKQAQSRVKALARMEKIAPILSEADFTFQFPEPDALPNPMVAIRDLDCGYATADAPRIIVQGITQSLLPGQRIGILGANGQGKSTFVKTLAQELPPIHGEVTEGKGLKIGYFAQQELDVLDSEANALEHMIRLSNALEGKIREQELRDFLGQFNFSGAMAQQTVGSMSGGEKARLVLAMLVWQRPNLLLLDEPTNHLDLTTREALSMALNSYEGSVLLVSHDRSLLREVCDEFWLVADQQLRPFHGDLDDYQQWILQQAKNNTNTSGASKSPKKQGDIEQRQDRRGKSKSVDAKKPVLKKLTELEEKMQRLTQDKEELLAFFNLPNPKPDEIDQKGRQLSSINATLDLMESEWIELSEKLQSLDNE